MKNKQTFLVVLAIAGIVAVHYAGYSVYQIVRQAEVDYLLDRGIRTSARITNLKEYYPPPSMTRYGQVEYRFTDGSGKDYTGSLWISREEMDLLRQTPSASVYYHPADPRKSILKIQQVVRTEGT